MTTLAVSNNLRPVSQENSADLYENFSDVATWANGSVSDTNFSSGHKVGPGLSLRRVLFTAHATSITGTTATTYHLTRGGGITQSAVGWAWDSSVFGISSLTGAGRLMVHLLTNATAPSASYTFALYPITAASAASGSPPVFTIGSAVTGSSVTFTTPSASTLNYSSASFTLPSTGSYVIGFVPSASQAASSYMMASAEVSVTYS